MKALVLGGTGFIGMNLVRALLASGHQVTATRRQRANTLFARKLGAALVTAELDDAETLTGAMRGHDVVFNCAAHYPRYSLDKAAEVELARRREHNTLESAQRAGVERYVLASSIATIGPPRAGKGYSDERDFPDRASLACVYHAVKAAVEETALASATGGPDVVALIPTAVIGELDVKAGTGALIVAVGNRALPFRVDGPTNLVDADDLARALILAAERGASGERYIVGGHNLSVTALLRSVADLLGVPLDAPLLPADVAGFRALLGEARVRAAGKGGRAPISRELVDMARFGRHVLNTKAQRELGLPAPTPLRATLKKACDWYARHRYLRPAQGASHARDIRVSDPG